MRKLLGSEPLVLASGSARRKDLLNESGLPFVVEVSAIDETPNLSERAEELVQRLALEKAQSIGKKFPRSWVIGADTIVCINGEIFGKPVDKKDAERMLSILQGTTHEVCSGIAVINVARQKKIVELRRTKVTMDRLSQSEMERYVNSGEPMDKAGAYALQGLGGHFVNDIQGSHSNVIGLDMCALFRILKSEGVIE